MKDEKELRAYARTRNFFSNFVPFYIYFFYNLLIYIEENKGIK